MLQMMQSLQNSISPGSIAWFYAAAAGLLTVPAASVEPWPFPDLAGAQMGQLDVKAQTEGATERFPLWEAREQSCRWGQVDVQQ